MESDEVFGCTDINACNYLFLATEDNNSVLFLLIAIHVQWKLGTGTVVDNDIDNDGIVIQDYCPMILK